MYITLLSVNYRRAGVALREKLALSGSSLEKAIDQLHGHYPEAELVLLSTCNRTELYIASDSMQQPSTAQLIGELSVLSGIDEATLTEVVVCLENEQAVEHLFRVASGLESMVLGEPQVLGQVKRAYETANGLQVVGPVFHRVFQRAIGVAKRVRTQTGIDSGRVSVGSVAVDFAKQIFERFDDKTILGIGAGEMAKPMLRQLAQLKPARLWLTNRSLDKAQSLMAQLCLNGQQSEAMAFEQLDDLLMEADIVLTSTSATEPIVTSGRFKPVLRRRRSKPLFLVDIAVPRDVEPEVGDLANVYLYNIDDLQRVVDQTHGLRSDQVCACESKLADAVRSCLYDVQNRELGQLVLSVKRRLQDLGSAERERTCRKLAACLPEELSQKVPELIEEHTHRLINKILHEPLSRLDHHNRESNLDTYTTSLRVLFGLEEDFSDVDQGGDLPSSPPQVKVTPQRPVSSQDQSTTNLGSTART